VPKAVSQKQRAWAHGAHHGAHHGMHSGAHVHAHHGKSFSASHGEVVTHPIGKMHPKRVKGLSAAQNIVTRAFKKTKSVLRPHTIKHAVTPKGI